MRLEDKGDGDFDVVLADDVRIEVSYSGAGQWKFWNVNFQGDRFGGAQYATGRFRDWLNVQIGREDEA